MPVALLVAIILVPIAELYVLIQVGQVIGVLPTLVLLVVDSVLGAWLLRREGARAWRAFRAALGERRVPAREVADGALVLFGGALLLTPGFLTDALGLLCILPPSRALLRRLLTGVVAARLGLVGTVGSIGAEGWSARARRRGARTTEAEVVEHEIVEGEVVDEHLHPPHAQEPPP